MPTPLAISETVEIDAAWSYELSAAGSGTRSPGAATFTLGTTALRPAIGGAAGHDRDLSEGIRTTAIRCNRNGEFAVLRQKSTSQGVRVWKRS